MHILPGDEILCVDKIKHLKKEARGDSGSEKIIDKINTKVNNREFFFGIEISSNLQEELDFNTFPTVPLFTAVTWLGSSNVLTQPIQNAPSLIIGRVVKESVPVLTHISCYKLNQEKLTSILSDDVENVLAIRGDFVDHDQNMKYASDLVKAIRQIRGSGICIGVGGYPEMHPESKSKEDDLRFLKQKVDFGADFIITQVCFSSSKIIEFVNDCRHSGINVPIIPGIYVPSSFMELNAMCNITKVSVPVDELEQYRVRKDNFEDFQEYAINNAVTLIQNLRNSNQGLFGVHFFTLNHFNCVKRIIGKIL